MNEKAVIKQRLEKQNYFLKVKEFKKISAL